MVREDILISEVRCRNQGFRSSS